MVADIQVHAKAHAARNERPRRRYPRRGTSPQRSRASPLRDGRRRRRTRSLGHGPAVKAEAQSRCPAIRISTRRGGADGRSTSFVSLRRSAHASLRRGVRRRRRPGGEVVLPAPAAAVVAGLRGDQSGKFGYPFLPRIVPLVAGVNGAHHQHVDLSVELHAPGSLPIRTPRRTAAPCATVQMLSRYSGKMEFICESAMMASAARSSALRQ